ncbi:hypothetical protein BKA62DRAFT_721690 [Auriculariales sp. MPI-PUGE-AT-0066]|nr:hypothetical protein BKA62DRAFT_721690 [Auriculariales sp. MPI-PUGE-AT-0066]
MPFRPRTSVRKLARSLSLEPDANYSDDLRVIPLSGSPWVPEAPVAEAESKPRRVDSSHAVERPVSTVKTGTLSSLPHDDSKSRPLSFAESVSARPGYFGQIEHVQSPQSLESPNLPVLEHFPQPAGEKSSTPQDKEAEEELDAQDASAEVETRGTPPWLGIFFDLAWTVTFSNLSNSTSLTTISSLVNYGIFLALCWTLWMTQVLYDVKYFTNDWFHRVQLLLQLVIFGALGAFTKDFDAFNESVDPSRVPQDQFVDVVYSRKTNLGISILFVAARILLAISYLRVLLHLPNYQEAIAQRKRLIYHIIAYLASSAVFAVAFLVVLWDFNASVQEVKLLLWTLGLAIEILERVASLTTIILGEGLNSLGQKLILTASTTGFGARRLGRIILMMALVIVFAFLLYFDGLRRRAPRTRGRSRVNVLLHFPLHCSIIVLIQSLKNNFIYASLRDQANWFDSAASTAFMADDMPGLNKAFRNIGIDLNATLASSYQRQQQANGGRPTSPEDEAEVFRMIVAQAVLKIFQNFDEVSDQMNQKFTEYMYSFNSTARFDSTTSTALNENLFNLLKGHLADLDASSLWIPLSGGVFLIILAFIVLVNSDWFPQHRYIWGTALSRTAMGVLVVSVIFFKKKPSVWNYLHDNAMLSVIVATAFGLQFAIDQILIYVAEFKRKRKARRIALKQSSIRRAV